MTRKNYNRHIQSLKHKKNERRYNRNKIIESANEDGIKVTNEDIEQQLDEQYTRSGYTNTEEGIKFCDCCDMYLDNNTAYNKHVTTLEHRNNVRLVSGEIVRKESKFDCVICKTSLSQYSVDQHLKTKKHLDNVTGKSKDNISKDITVIAVKLIQLKDIAIYVIIGITIKMNTMNQMNIRKMLIRKNLLMVSGEIKLMS